MYRDKIAFMPQVDYKSSREKKNCLYVRLLCILRSDVKFALEVRLVLR